MITVRWTRPQDLEAGTVDALREVLDAGECERALRFRAVADRNAFIAAHALLRLCLSEHAAREPSDWHFVVDAHGKPFVRDGLPSDVLYTSLSHTRTCVAVAVTRDCPIGIDIEDVARFDTADMPLQAAFTESEIRLVQASDPLLRSALCATLWTLKEAVFKCGGDGSQFASFAPARAYVVSVAAAVRCIVRIDQVADVALLRAVQTARAMR